MEEVASHPSMTLFAAVMEAALAVVVVVVVHLHLLYKAVAMETASMATTAMAAQLQQQQREHPQQQRWQWQHATPPVPAVWQYGPHGAQVLGTLQPSSVLRRRVLEPPPHAHMGLIPIGSPIGTSNSAATDHITGDLNKLTIRDKYNRNEKVYTVVCR
jgi:hypothetical protein